MSHDSDEQSLFELHAEGASAEAQAHSEENEQQHLQPIRFDRVIAPTKSNADLMAQSIVQAVEEGNINPVELGVKIRWLQDILERTYSGITGAIRTEAEKYGKEGIRSLGGARIDLSETSTKYDYSHDPVWASLQEKLEPIKAEIKERETMLKTLKKPFEQVDPETGEVIVVSPPLKTSVSGVKISLGK